MNNKALWIDKEKAHILTIRGDQVDMHTILYSEAESEIEYLERQGGASEIIKDRKVLERDKHRTRLYFDAIIKELSDVKSMVVIGPAQMGQHFVKYLRQDQVSLGKKVKEVVRSHKMTTNQLIAMAKEFFSSSS